MSAWAAIWAERRRLADKPAYEASGTPVQAEQSHSPPRAQVKPPAVAAAEARLTVTTPRRPALSHTRLSRVASGSAEQRRPGPQLSRASR